MYYCEFDTVDSTRLWFNANQLRTGIENLRKLSDLPEGDPAKPKYDLAWTHNHLHGKPQPHIPTPGFKVVDGEPAAHIPLLSRKESEIDPKQLETAPNMYEVVNASSVQPFEKALDFPLLPIREPEIVPEQTDTALVQSTNDVSHASSEEPSEKALEFPLLSIVDTEITPEQTDNALVLNKNDVTLPCSVEQSEKELNDLTPAGTRDSVSIMILNARPTDMSDMGSLQKIFGDCGARNLLVSLGLRFDLTVVVKRAGVPHFESLDNTTRYVLALIVELLGPGSTPIGHNLRREMLDNGLDLAARYRHLEILRLTPQITENLEKEYELITQFYKHNDNWTKVRREYIPPPAPTFVHPPPCPPLVVAGLTELHTATTLSTIPITTQND